MNRQIAQIALVAVAVVFSTAWVQAGNNPLLDALVKKGVLSASEAEEIADDMGDGNAIHFGNSAVKKLKLYGDVRLRYQWEDAEDSGAGAVNNNDRSRFRYRVRVGLDYKFADNFRAGVRLETAEANDSTNVDFGGYFDKAQDDIYVGLAYLEYENSDLFAMGGGPKSIADPLVDYVNVRVGKHKHPFMLSKAFWDGDINPEGFSQQIGFDDAFVDGLDITVRGGQYIISNTDERRDVVNAGASTGNNDAWLFVGQIEARYHFAKKSSVAIAPMFFYETKGDLVDEERTTRAGARTNNSENADRVVGNLLVFAVPVEVKWKMWNQPWKAYGTWGINLAAGEMAQTAVLAGDASAGGQGEEDMFFNVGFQVGKAKKKGSWQLGAEYRYIEAFSYTGNLSDSDFNKNLFNASGVVLKGKYALTNNIYLGATYFWANGIASDLDIDNGGTTSESDANTSHVVQLDLNWKF